MKPLFSFEDYWREQAEVKELNSNGSIWVGENVWNSRPAPPNGSVMMNTDDWNRATTNPPPPTTPSFPSLYEMIYSIQNQQSETTRIMQDMLNAMKTIQSIQNKILERVEEQDRIVAQIKEEIHFVDSIMQ